MFLLNCPNNASLAWEAAISIDARRNYFKWVHSPTRLRISIKILPCLLFTHPQLYFEKVQDLLSSGQCTYEKCTFPKKINFVLKISRSRLMQMCTLYSFARYSFISTMFSITFPPYVSLQSYFWTVKYNLNTWQTISRL